MKERVILWFIVLYSTVFYAQFGKNCEIEQFKVNLITPSFEYERGLGVNTTLDIKLGIQLTVDPTVLKPLEDYGIFPSLIVQYRYYYNFNQRDKKRKQIYGNSANYVAPIAAIFVPLDIGSGINVSQDPFTYLGMVTGIQRSYNSGFNFSLDFGAAYYFETFNGGIYPVANLSIGWILSEKRWCVGR